MSQEKNKALEEGKKTLWYVCVTSISTTILLTGFSTSLGKIEFVAWVTKAQLFLPMKIYYVQGYRLIIILAFSIVV